MPAGIGRPSSSRPSQTVSRGPGIATASLSNVRTLRPWKSTTSRRTPSESLSVCGIIHITRIGPRLGFGDVARLSGGQGPFRRARSGSLDDVAWVRVHRLVARTPGDDDTSYANTR